MIDFTEIQTLIRNNNTTELLEHIVKQPELLNYAFNTNGYPINLLTLAVRRNNTQLVRALIDLGAKPVDGNHARDSLILNLLSSGSYDKSPSIDILKYLIDIGEKFPSDKASCDALISHRLENMYAYDWVDLLNSMIELGFDPVATEKIANVSFIEKSLASHYEKLSKIPEILLTCGCSANGLGNYHSPLERAIELHLYTYASKLLDHGADLSKMKEIPCKLAGHPKIPAQLRNRLLKNIDFSRDKWFGMLRKKWVGKSPIHAAVEENNEIYVSFLVESGMDINLKSKSATPLFYAIECNVKNMITHLIELGADLNTLNDKLETALDLALTQPGFKHTCSAMVKAGAKTSFELSGGQNNIKTIMKSINRAIQSGEAWASSATKALNKLDLNQAVLWNTLFRHCLDNNSSKPSKKWMKEATSLVEGIGDKQFREYVLTWFPLVKEKRIGKLKVHDDDYSYASTDHVISENNTRLLKGLIWISCRYNDAEMSRTLRELATQMYKKVYGVGMRNAKLSNAALYSLSVMSGTAGLKEIIVMRAATKYNPALVSINRIFDKLAEERGKTPDELAELSTPEYGLTGVGSYEKQFGNFSALVNLVSVGKCELVWVSKNKRQKSVPAAIKSDFSEEIKSLKGLIKDIQTGSSAHSYRLEKMYLRRQSLDYKTWLGQYIDHKLIGFLARRLIWRYTVKDISVDIIYTDQGFITCEEKFITVPICADIYLWHPSMSSPQEVLAWRTLLMDHEITQPFKQAHREIYLLTDAERETRNHSMRFAYHILKHTQFHALATQRGWHQQRGGSWDGGSENSAYKSISDHQISVDFDAEGAEAYDYTDSGIYECVATGAVKFTNKELVNLEDIDPLIFSEVMRDIDLFVGVTSIGNDPDWRDRENIYWTGFSFGELSASALTRKEVLGELIPKLKISDQLKIDDRFLVVEGKIRSYKIHLGTSNILMSPNDSYLCIVSSRTKVNVMLPFEGDHTLSLILSKAMMLANDTKIKDKSILSQIEYDDTE